MPRRTAPVIASYRQKINPFTGTPGRPWGCARKSDISGCRGRLHRHVTDRYDGALVELLFCKPCLRLLGWWPRKRRS